MSREEDAEEEGGDNMQEDVVDADVLDGEVEEQGQSTKGTRSTSIGSPVPNEDNNGLITFTSTMLSMASVYQNYKRQRKQRYKTDEWIKNAIQEGNDKVIEDWLDEGIEEVKGGRTSPRESQYSIDSDDFIQTKVNLNFQRLLPDEGREAISVFRHSDVGKLSTKL